MTQYPLIVALPLDDDTGDILATSLELGSRMDRSLIVVHALGSRALESEEGEERRIAEAERRLDERLVCLRNAGLDVSVRVAVQSPAELVLETAHREHAELIIMGGGRPTTVRRWLVGSVAEAVVRAASSPVWIVRGTTPVDRSVLCPVDMSPQSRRAFIAAERMAQLWDAPLRLLTVAPEGSDEAALETARANVAALLEEHPVEGVEVEIRVVRGEPARRIVDAADDAGLLVIGSRGFDPLAPAYLGPVTSRTLRYGACSALMVREVDDDLKRRENATAMLADDYEAAWGLLDEGEAEEALVLLESAASRAPANAEVQEAYAVALERVGRDVEARGRHEIAATIRRRIRRE